MNGDEIKQPVEASQMAGVSIRAWLALIIVSSVCFQSLAVGISNVLRGESVLIEEPLYSMAVMALGFYFGQKSK